MHTLWKNNASSQYVDEDIKNNIRLAVCPIFNQLLKSVSECFACLLYVEHIVINVCPTFNSHIRIYHITHELVWYCILGLKIFCKNFCAAMGQTDQFRAYFILETDKLIKVKLHKGLERLKIEYSFVGNPSQKLWSITSPAMGSHNVTFWKNAHSNFLLYLSRKMFEFVQNFQGMSVINQALHQSQSLFLLKTRHTKKMKESAEVKTIS